jgi:hypothetical protein
MEFDGFDGPHSLGEMVRSLSNGNPITMNSRAARDSDNDDEALECRVRHARCSPTVSASCFAPLTVLPPPHRCAAESPSLVGDSTPRASAVEALCSVMRIVWRSG